MKIRIPNVDDKECYIEDKQSIVLLGANGAGKTRMSVWIDENNPELNIHRISAQKSLNMPEYVSPTELKKAEDKFLYGTTDDNRDWLKRYGKKSSRWGNEPEIHMLDDYQPLMELLMTENFEKSIEYREKHKDGDQEFDNETKLEKIKKIWEKVITHRKLKICAGKIEVESIEGISETYNGNLMSDGERAIFHFIAEVVSAEENSLIIIDEPENHLHNSILERLWNEIESVRQDCVYLYITHNLDFARTRNNTQIVWIKNMIDKQKWDYALLDSNEFSDDLLLEILGNRQGVLFVEGTQDKSIDRKLYSRLFPKYSIMPSADDAATVTKLENMYSDIFKGKTVVQDNIVLHNCNKCIDENGNSCECEHCPYAAEDRYLCELLYDKETEHYYVPSELPIPLNVFTVGTVNVDETTYMFSPKVLDRSNVIEFNEVDFGGLYSLSPAQIALVESASKLITTPDFYFDAGTDMPQMRITLPSAASVNDFASKCPTEFDVLIRLFAVLKKHNMHFGYRVMNEISCYMCNAVVNTTYANREQVAFDNQILQKVLPKIYGSYDKIWNPLVEMLGELLNTREDYSGLDADALIDKLKQISGGTIKSLELNGTAAKTYFKYPKSAIKIVEMLEDLELAGFATYIK